MIAGEHSSTVVSESQRQSRCVITAVRDFCATEPKN